MAGIGFGEFLALAVIALLVLGPDKLPKFAADAARMIKQVRKMADAAREDVAKELGPELQGISLSDLNPRTAMRKHVLDDLGLDDDERPARSNGGPAQPRSTGGSSSTSSQVPPRYDPDAT